MSMPMFNLPARYGIAIAALPLRAMAASATRQAPALNDPTLGAGYLFQFFLGLLVVLGAIVALAWFMRRFGGLRGGAGDRLRVIGALSVGTRERVVLLEVGEKQLVVGVAAGQVRLLHALEEPVAPPPAPDNDGKAFSSRLARALKGQGSAR